MLTIARYYDPELDSEVVGSIKSLRLVSASQHDEVLFRLNVLLTKVWLLPRCNTWVVFV